MIILYAFLIMISGSLYACDNKGQYQSLPLVPYSGFHDQAQVPLCRAHASDHVAISFSSTLPDPNLLNEENDEPRSRCCSRWSCYVGSTVGFALLTFWASYAGKLQF